MEKEREYYLDWLRFIVVMLLIPHHTAVSFSHIGNGYIYTDEAVDSLYYILQSDFLNLWFMKLLFFISGISSFMALKKRSTKEYLKERFTKLLIPAVFVTLCLGPLTAFMVASPESLFAGSIIDFYPLYLSNITKYLGWAHMWFCVYLFVFSMLLLPLFSYFIKRPAIIKWLNFFLETKQNYLLPMFIIIVFEILLRPFFPGYQNLINDWANFTVYLSFFLFGFIMGQNRDLLSVLKSNRMTSGVIAALSSILYIFIKRTEYFQNSHYPIIVLLSLLSGVSSYTWVMFIVGMGKKYLNRTNTFLAYLSQVSFPLYIFHYTILSILNLFLIRTSLNHYIIFMITCVSTYIIFFVFFELIIKRVKFLRYICGLKVERSRKIMDRQALY
jgi:hypothetical protein